VDFAAACLAGGARFLQVRAKHLDGAAFLALAERIVALADAASAIVLVNDRADIARLAQAHGVHVGQDDLAPHQVRSILGDDAIVGLSTHTMAQVEEGLGLHVSYLAIGPVFETRTKSTGYSTVGTARVRDVTHAAGARGLPVVAIGGITLANAREVRAAGAASVAVISDLLVTGDPAARTRQYLQQLA
jgi:thiamine-phosphate pyrophosphorylase